MTRVTEPVLAGHRLGPGLHHCGLDLHRLAAVAADQVMVVPRRTGPIGHLALGGAYGVQLVGLRHGLQRPVHGGEADLVALLEQGTVDLLGGVKFITPSKKRTDGGALTSLANRNGHGALQSRRYRGEVLRRGFLTALVSAAGLATLAACGQQGEPAAKDETKVLVAQPWVRTTDGSTQPTMSAAFMDLTNPGATPVTLVKASSDVAATVELHRMVTVEGKKMMEPAPDGIVIEPGSHRHLVSGGYHIMLMGLKKELPIGDEVTLTLEFDNGQVETITAMVKEFTEEEDHYHTPTATP